MKHAALLIFVFVFVLVLSACGSESSATPSKYAFVEPPAGTVAQVLHPETWSVHYDSDLRPYWTMSDALGSPEGNFPTYRGMDGLVTGSTVRYPRMLSRQIYAYSAGYLISGDPTLLQHARAGVTWLLDHARDPNGGWYALLDASGNPSGTGNRTAQDAAYCGLGLAAYYFVTRDPAAESALLALRDLLFDPTKYWDATNHRIRDALTADMTTEVNVDDPGWELVAQLDPINAFLLLSQPVLSEASRRQQFLDDLQTLAQTLRDDFFQDGIFWGVNGQRVYGANHVDFGHTLKAFWMILQIDKRLPNSPFYDFVLPGARAALDRAWDQPNGRWAKAPTSTTTVSYGSDWWAYAEADQLASTLDLIDYAYVDRVAQTSQNWLTDYVDTTRAAREVVSSIDRYGNWVYNWPNNDTGKCNEWKNGYHSSEHALVMYTLSQALADGHALLHFAVPAAIRSSFVATPYFFQGHESSRLVGAEITVGSDTLTQVDVTFDRIY